MKILKFRKHLVSTVIKKTAFFLLMIMLLWKVKTSENDSFYSLEDVDFKSNEEEKNDEKKNKEIKENKVESSKNTESFSAAKSNENPVSSKSDGFPDQYKFIKNDLQRTETKNIGQTEIFYDAIQSLSTKANENCSKDKHKEIINKNISQSTKSEDLKSNSESQFFTEYKYAIAAVILVIAVIVIVFVWKNKNIITDQEEEEEAEEEEDTSFDEEEGKFKKILKDFKSPSKSESKSQTRERSLKQDENGADKKDKEPSTDASKNHSQTSVSESNEAVLQTSVSESNQTISQTSVSESNQNISQDSVSELSNCTSTSSCSQMSTSIAENSDSKTVSLSQIVDSSEEKNYSRTVSTSKTKGSITEKN